MRKKLSKKVLIPIGIILVLALLFVLLKPLLFNEVMLSEPEPIAVLPFENLTGDSTYNIFQKSITNILIAKLEQSKYLRVTTWERMSDLLKQIRKEKIDIAKIDKETGFELCHLDGVSAAVTGTYLKIGDRFDIEVKMLDATSKKILVSEPSNSESENSIFNQIDKLTQQISKSVNLSWRKFMESQQPITFNYVPQQSLSFPLKTSFHINHKIPDF